MAFPIAPNIGDRYTFNNVTYEWNGAAWDTVAVIGDATVHNYEYIATEGQTVFAAGYYLDKKYVDVYLNGVKLADSDYTANDNANVTLAVGATLDDVVTIRVFDVLRLAELTSDTAVTTLAEGENATASFVDGVLTLGVPVGATGVTGNGITDITFTSTTDGSGLPAQSGATDTYTITYTNGDTTTYEVYNGLDGAESVMEQLEETVVADASFYDVTVDTTTGYFEVFWNGSKLATSDYTLNGTYVRVLANVKIGDIIVVKKLSTYAVMDAYTQATMDSLLANKADKLQTSATTTSYTDATTATQYKIYVDNGEIIMEEL